MEDLHGVIIQALEDVPKNFTGIHNDIQQAVSDGRISKAQALSIVLKVLDVLIKEAIKIALIKLAK